MRRVLEAAACLGASAVLLSLGLSLTAPGGTRPHPVTLDGFSLALSGGEGERRLDGLAVAPVPEGKRATLLRRGLALDAGEWEHAEVRFAGDPARPLLLWQSDARTLGTPLIRHGDVWAAQWLPTREAWHGEVSALGVGLVGPVADGVTVESIRLVPRSAAATRAGVRRDWSAFEGLGGHSGNFVIGGASGERPLWRPVPAAATWAGLALALHLLWCRARGRRADRIAIATIMAAAWLLLDARWQVDLLRQHARTRERYAGLDPAQKAAAGEDVALVTLADRVAAALPEAPQPLSIVTRDPEGGDRYLQMRTRYRLLPHSVGPARSHPPASGEAPAGSYVVVFEPRDDVAFDADAGELRWDPSGAPLGEGAAPASRPARRLFSLPLASLYQVR